MLRKIEKGRPRVYSFKINLLKYPERNINNKKKTKAGSHKEELIVNIKKIPDRRSLSNGSY